MTSTLANHLWQSTVFAIALALLTLCFRRNRAQVRYWLWWTASVKFLLPFTILTAAATRIDIAPTAKVLPSPVASAVLYEISEPFSSTQSPQIADSRPSTLPFIVWSAGALCLAAIRVRRYLQLRSTVREASPLPLDAPLEVRSTTARLEPGIAGFRRPILLLPAGIEQRLTPRQLDSIVAHELCHARRRDNVTAAVHMFVETVFWFHPLVWWVGARLVEERERACDEAVIAAGLEPRDYADAIVNVCRFYVESPLACVSGVTGADIKQRLRAILVGAAAHDLTTPQKISLALFAAAAVAIPFLAGLLSPPLLRAQAVKFEVASIRPCKAGETGGEGRKTDTKAGGAGPRTSPGRLVIPCNTVESLIRSAYILYSNDRLNRDPSNPPLEGGPSWIRSERYQITAKAEGAPDAGVMNGPLMRALLEDRFKLKVHREAREVPVYTLTVARSGPRLTPSQPGSCTPVEFGRADGPVENPCRVLIRQRGPNLALEGKGGTLAEVSKLLYLLVDRPVVDRTELPGRFDLDVEFAPEQVAAAFRPAGEPVPPTPASTEEPTAPRIFVAFEKQLGLKLEAAKGPREYVIVDHVERPSKN
jgi:bla regulator protein blaR1